VEKQGVKTANQRTEKQDNPDWEAGIRTVQRKEKTEITAKIIIHT